MSICIKNLRDCYLMMKQKRVLSKDSMKSSRYRIRWTLFQQASLKASFSQLALLVAALLPSVFDQAQLCISLRPLILLLEWSL